MVRFNWKLLAALGVVVSGLLGSATVQAGWHWYGGSGGSGGCYGSYGCVGYSSFGSHGCYGGYSSYGCYGGGWRMGAHLHHKVHRMFHHGSWGCHGGYRGYRGCYGGSWGCSGGSYGCSGGCSGGTVYYGCSGGGCSGGGCSGGSYGGCSGGTIHSAPATPAAPAPAGSLPEVAPQNKQATLQVEVPEDALVYVNGTLTKSTGAQRTYVSRGLNDGFQYSYEVRAEAIRDGKKVEESKVVQLKAGDRIDLAFDNLQPMQLEETKLTLKVPAEAKVTLGGNPVPGEGDVRVFTTTKLAGDQAWSNYIVQVSVEQNGRVLTREKTITLKAGESKTLDFDFDDTKVAVAR